MPADLPDQARVALGLMTADPGWWWTQVRFDESSYGYDALDDWNAVWGLRPLWWYSEEFVAVDAHRLCVVRNLLDLDLIMTGERCAEHAANEGVAPPRDGEGCLWCDFCRSLLMRDRIDLWLLRSGHRGSSYFQGWHPVRDDAAVEELWGVVWSGDRYPA